VHGCHSAGQTARRLSLSHETIRVMGVAFVVLAALRLHDRDDLAVEIIAKKIIELAKEGERNPDLLCERAFRDLGALPPKFEC
jgi:hypothetical protein